MICHDNYFSAAAKKMDVPYLIRKRTTVYTPTTINLGSGLPNPEYFPFKEATVTMENGEVLHLTKEQMDKAFQYGMPSGYGKIPDLKDHLKDMVIKLHAPPHMAERKLFAMAGSNGCIYVLLHTFVDPGDYVFIPESTYPTFIAALKTTEARVVSVPSDRQGMRPDLLRDALKSNSDGRRKLLYIVPSGDNPTGITLGEDRRREIYSLACEYDILIMEDDPYYFQQYGPKIPPTFLSLDTEGRVLRLDSFSKIIGGGARLSYLIADTPFMDKLEPLISLIFSQASGFIQMMVSEMLQRLGHDGFLQLTRNIAQGYLGKRNMVLQAATKHLSGLCEWNEADGMFLWLKVLGVDDVKEMVEKTCTERGLVLIPGSACMWDSTQPSPYIRMSYSVITPETADKGFQILADVIKEELKKTKTSEKIN